MQGDAGERLEAEPLLRMLLEGIAARMGMRKGNWTLEVRFADGAVRDFRQHYGPAPAKALDDYTAEPRYTRGGG